MRGVSVLVLLAVTSLAAAQLNFFNGSTVFDYIKKSSLSDSISERCQSGLKKIEKYLDRYDSIEDQRLFFAGAYTTGESEQFASRDQDRWLFRAFECLQAAGETAYSKSEYPLHFCFGYNAEREKDTNNTAYGICIPSVCYDDRRQLLNKWRHVTSNVTYDLDYIACTKSRHDKQWYQKFIPVLEFGLNFLFILIVVVATIYHYRKGEQTKSLVIQVLLAFSAKKNFKKLVTMPKDAQSTITCMFGMRFLSMCWTLIGHSFIFVQAYIKNVDEYKNDMVNPFFNQWITNFTLSVDTFFVLSATLTAYIWFKQMNKCPHGSEPTWTSWGYWLRYYRHRVIRLWPAYIYALVDVGARTALQHYHPMWPPTDPAVQCPKYWWQNILFVNSILDNRCMPWTWYIGTEFIFYLLSPIFLLTLRSSANAGILLSTAVIAASSMLNVIGMVAYNFPPTQMLWKQPKIFSADFIQHHLVMYIKPQYRIGSYIVGLLLGYYLAYNQKLAVPNQPTFRFKFIGWVSASIAGFWSIFGLYPSLQGWNMPIYHLIFGALHRTVFALAISWLIYACHSGMGGIVNTILSLKFLLPLSSLCYSVYLFHMVMVVFTYLLVPFPIIYTSKWPIFLHCFVQLLLSYVLGISCSMLSELPALNLERIVFGRDSKTTLKPVKLKECEAHLKSIDGK
uniref:Acyl_transf_3 domain-containing protein n=1 Tax=Syphacia muris TaxID=451379 RepID=A0A0N5AHJ5_9BILA